MRCVADIEHCAKKSLVKILPKKHTVNHVVLDVTKDHNRRLCEQQLVKRKNIEHNLVSYLQKQSTNSTSKLKRIISLDTDLKLHPTMTKTTEVKNVTKVTGPIMSKSIMGNRLVMELSDYLTLTEKNQGKFILKLLTKDKAPMSIVKNFKSDKSVIQSIPLAAVPVSHVIKQPMVKKACIEKQASEEKTTNNEGLQQPQKMFVIVPKENCTTIGKQPMIIQQPGHRPKLCTKLISPASANEKRIKTIMPTKPAFANEKRIKTIMPTKPAFANEKRIKTIMPTKPALANEKRIKTIMPTKPAFANEKRIKTILPIAPVSAVEKRIKTIMPIRSASAHEKRIKTIMPVKPAPTNEKRIKTIMPNGLLRLPSIKTAPTTSQQVSAISQPIPILPKQPVICRPRTAATKRKTVNEQQRMNEKKKCDQKVKSLSLIEQYSRSPLETEPTVVNRKEETKQTFSVRTMSQLEKQIFSVKTLPTVVNLEKETNQIFPVALAPSDSYDFEYMKIFDNGQDESETQILGI